jgi:hypothetical protein
MLKILNICAELKHGEACLVCGSTEHPYRDDESQLSKALYEFNNNKSNRLKRTTAFNFGKTLSNNSPKFVRFKELNSNCVQSGKI